jgi:tetratricopeptide (TPR) repeat protein
MKSALTIRHGGSSTIRSRMAVGYSLALATALAGCASTSATKVATQPEVPAASDAPTSRNVQAVSLETSAADGQASWLITPGEPRVPKIAGLDAPLPPNIEQRLNYAFDLAQRGATYSASAEFEAVLGLCALELDTRDGGTSHRDALRQGLIALAEAEDFSGERVDWRESADVRSIAAGHTTTTPAKNSDAPVDSIQAVQAYYVFAEERLSYACGQLPGSSLAFYGLGRTIMIPDSSVTHAAGKAALYHRVALTIAPQNTLSGNELGVLLAQYGRLDEAEKLFQQCVATSGAKESYQNLLAVNARKNNERADPGVVTAGQVPAMADASETVLASAETPVTPATSAPSSTSQPDTKQTEPSAWGKLRLTPKLPQLF